MAEPGDPLSERELDVLRCLVRGATNKTIASDLTISENTVKVHLRNIYTKLEVSSRTEAATAAMQQGYITIPSAENVEETLELETPLETKRALEDEQVLETPPAKVDAAAATVIRTTEFAGEDAAATTMGEASATAPERNYARLAVIALAVVLALITVVFIAQQSFAPGQQSTAEEPFEETAIENTLWLESRPMPEGRSNMAVGSIGLDLYQIGGETTDGVDGKVQAFNSLDRVWRTVAEKPTAVADATAAELYGELYVAGGRMADGRPTSVVEAYSPTQDAWRPVAPLPHPVLGGLTLSDGAFLYLFGGHDGESFVDAAYVYDPAEDSWRPLPAMPRASAFTSGGTLPGKLVVAGGENEDGTLSSCLLLDVAEATWSECPAMLLPRKGAGSAVLLNKLYVIGGTAKEGQITYSEMYDPESETWQVINTPMLVESAEWPHPGIGQIETRIYALGGRDGEAFMNNTYVFAPLVYQTYIPAASSPDEE
jgi:DNA-binding CsgD family transcriptional regulator/N-acetylneuraminic acid mutarotase